MGIENVNTLKGLIAKANRVMGLSKKLKDKPQKKMNKTSYCGPNKSFPATDRAHIAVSRAYLGKSKFSEATKKKIAVCINRKVKALGLVIIKTVKANRNYPIYIELSYVEKQLYMSDTFASTKTLVDDSLNNPGMVLNEIDIIV